VEAAGGELKNLQHRTEQHERRATKILTDAEATAAKLSEQTVTVTVKAGENNRLYGRVTATDIATAISKSLNVSVDKRKVGLLDPIKALGEYDVPIKLHKDVTVTLKVAVAAEA
jgi:large subunit ribosomal protein L9